MAVTCEGDFQVLFLENWGAMVTGNRIRCVPDVRCVLVSTSMVRNNGTSFFRLGLNLGTRHG